MRPVGHASWLSHIDTGMRAFSSEQGPGLSSKCSAEGLDRQLVSAVLSSSVGQCSARSSVCCNKAWLSSSVLRVYVNLQT